MSGNKETREGKARGERKHPFQLIEWRVDGCTPVKLDTKQATRQLRGGRRERGRWDLGVERMGQPIPSFYQHIERNKLERA